MDIPEPRFRKLVAETMESLFEQLDEVEVDDIDPVLSAGVFSCLFEFDGSTYVLSQQVPVRELWLSANRTAWHFRFRDDRWHERDTGEDMLELLSRLYSEKLDHPVRFRY